jgi:hypothetical protein
MIKNQSSPTYDEFYNWVTTGYKSQINITRSKDRVVLTNEIFTGLDIVMYGLELAYPEDFFKDPSIIFSDNCVGEGAWLVGMALLRMRYGKLTHAEAVSNLRGIDIMIDNVDACRIRLMCGQTSLKDTLEQNIVFNPLIKRKEKRKGGALNYGYRFSSMNPARKKTEEQARIRQQKLKNKQEKLAKQEEEQKKKEADDKKKGFETALPPPAKNKKPKKIKKVPLDISQMTQ